MEREQITWQGPRLKDPLTEEPVQGKLEPWLSSCYTRLRQAWGVPQVQGCSLHSSVAVELGFTAVSGAQLAPVCHGGHFPDCVLEPGAR